MESCCDVSRAEPAAAQAVCPLFALTGLTVERITVKAMLRPDALARLSAPGHRFCATPGCPIVYFGSGETFKTGDITTPVFQKEPPGHRTVCYCFGVTEADLRSEIAHAGRSEAGARIAAHVKAERCACEVKNPQGSCCLGNVASVLREAAAL